MAALAYRRVSVWLDALAPERGAFAHALDWAGHLSLPLRAIAAQGRTTDRLGGDAGSEADGLEEDIAPLIDACAARCDRTGVPLDATRWYGPAAGVRGLLDPTELCVFGRELPARLRGTLLRETVQSSETSALVCPTEWRTVSRILILYQHSISGDSYLATAAGLCRQFDCRPVVLAVARTDGEARSRQRAAERALAADGISADFDAVVGTDVRTAVSSAAKWRRCSHVIVGKSAASGWWRRLRGDPIEQLLGQSDSLTFLALPDAGGPARQAAAEEIHAMR